MTPPRENPPLGGRFAPVTTPFDDAGGPDPGRLAAQIEIYADFPLNGVVLFGTSGEGPLLETEEERPLLEVARRALPETRSLIVQIGRESAPATRAAARRAADAGADALLCLPPRYYALDSTVVARFFRDVAEAVECPLLAYHIPQRSKVEMDVELILELARDGALSGIKDSAGDLELQARLLREAGPNFTVLNGKATVVAEALRQGAHGAVLAVADVVPEIVVALFDAHAAGDPSEARTIQERLRPLAECLGPRFGVPGIKAALDLRGWPGGGAPRPPLVALDGGGRRLVAEALAEAGVDVGAAGRPV